MRFLSLTRGAQTIDGHNFGRHFALPPYGATSLPPARRLHQALRFGRRAANVQHDGGLRARLPALWRHDSRIRIFVFRLRISERRASAIGLKKTGGGLDVRVHLANTLAVAAPLTR